MADPFHPKVSIVIPVYNGANYLREAIESALHQTYDNIEVIVVNDGSDDGGATEQIARSYGDRIRYIRKDNGGVASALNAGICAMAGEYFSWLSHDDRYLPHKIAAQIDYLRLCENKDIILYSDVEVIDECSRFVRQERFPHHPPDRFFYELMQSSFVHGCALLIPKVCFDTVGVFDERLVTTNDYDLWVRMAKRYDFIHLPHILIQGRTHAAQGCHQRLHLEEVDDFYSACVHLLQPEEIVRLYRMKPSEFCLKLAEGYRQRCFMKATRAFSERARRFAEEEALASSRDTKPRHEVREQE